MSRASECDVCGAVTKSKDSVGTIALDVHIVSDTDGTSRGWSDVELCLSCSKKVIAIIKSALSGYKK